MLDAVADYEVLVHDDGGLAGVLPPAVSVAMLPDAPVRYSYDDGEKFPGGFGPTELLFTDYWTLRARSSQLFERNLYARGLIRRLITNEINTGLHLEATPEEVILGHAEDDLADWTENVENRFHLWERRPSLCDRAERMTFGQLQAAARAEALIAGDVLVVLVQDRLTKLPRVLLVRGDRVRSPSIGGMFDGGKLANGNRIVHGVEVDAVGKHVAFWISKNDGPHGFGLERYERLAAYGGSGRRQAWLVYGTDKRLDQVRGKPLLSLMLQSLNEIDKYRDSTQRKAVINSILAMWVEKTEEKPASRALTAGAVRRGATAMADAEGKRRQFPSMGMVPGLMVEELQTGEKIHGFPATGTDEKFRDFESAVLRTIAWANELPPEILELSFTNNYSASQAAINELKMYLNRVRTDWGSSFCQPIYEDWLLSEMLLSKIQAPGLFDAWRDPLQYDTYAAWMTADWTGHIKPAVDMSKLVKGYAEQVRQGFMTRDRAARELNGTKYSKNVQKLKRENAQLVEAMRELIELEESAGAANAPAPDELPTTPQQPSRPQRRGRQESLLRGDRLAAALEQIVDGDGDPQLVALEALDGGGFDAED